MTRIMPPEWAPQQWLWIGFPHAAEEWPGYLGRAQEQIAAFANAVAASGQEVRLVVRDDANEARARGLVSDAVTIKRHVYGDIWLRDTGPLVVQENGAQSAQLFGFNGWGGKYVMPGDTEIGAALAAEAGLATSQADWIFEGGAIDGDGTGLAITTEQCLLNPNRNPHLSREDIDMRLHRDLGFDRIVWLGDGLINDHTDGHVDNLARFVAPGTIALPVPSGPDDPHRDVLADAHARARAAGLDIAPIPSPGRIEYDGVVQPASYMNFAITSKAVIVPVYGSRYDDAGVAAISALFPAHETIGIMADAVLKGGGSFHCASQQMPV